jgi:GNAT superfamily N-acetyltransferase
MDNDAFKYLAIRTEPEQYCGRPDEPSHYIHEVSGKVVLIDESDSVSKEVGEFACSLIDADAADLNGISPFDVYDTTQATYNVYYALFDELGANARVKKALSGDELMWSHNLLVIDRLIIYPAFRGEKIGLRVLAMLLQRYQHIAEFAALKPFPLQFEAGMESDEVKRLGLARFSCTLDYGRRRLAKYYGGVGFTRCPGCDFMVRAAGVPLPS